MSDDLMKHRLDGHDRDIRAVWDFLEYEARLHRWRCGRIEARCERLQRRVVAFCVVMAIMTVTFAVLTMTLVMS